MGLFDTSSPDSGLMASLSDPATQAYLGMMSGLFQAGAPSRLPVTFGQAIGSGVNGAIQGANAGYALNQQDFNNQMQKARMKVLMNNPWFNNGSSPPSSEQVALAQGANAAPAAPADQFASGGSAPAGAGPTNFNAGLMNAQSPAPQQSSAQPSRGNSGTLFGVNPSDAFQYGQLLTQIGDPSGKEIMSAAAQMSMPTDYVKTLLAAGIDPNSMLGKQLIQQNIVKQNYIAPTPLRSPQYITPDGQVHFLPSAPPSGFMTQGDEKSGYSYVPVGNGLEAVQQSNYAEAAGSKGYAPVSSRTLPSSPAGAPPAVGMPQYSPGSDAAINSMATANAKRASDLVTQASDSPTRVNVLDNIINLSKSGVQTGPGQSWKMQIAGYAANTPILGDVYKMISSQDPKEQVAGFQELQKFTYQNGLRAWQAAGGTGTDAQMESFSHANPNDKLFPQALQSVAQWSRAGELALQAKANAQDDFLARNGNNPQAQNQFESVWRKNFDPRIYQMAQMSMPERAQFMKQQKDGGALASKVDFALSNGWIQ